MISIIYFIGGQRQLIQKTIKWKTDTFAHCSIANKTLILLPRRLL